MELTTTLESQTVRVGVREVGINPDYWYAVDWAHKLKAGKVMRVQIWHQAIALYRDTQGQLHALENVCPHKGVDLHTGDVVGDRLVCGYHGWEFDGSGVCVRIPYLPEQQKLPPCAQTRSFPVQERYGLIWVFPGDPSLATVRQPPEMPEYDNPEWLAVPIEAHFNAHFSICNENTIDVFHGYLHKNLQGWFDPVLIQLQDTENSVSAQYRVSYQGILSKFLGLSESGDVTTKAITVNYRYPNYFSSLDGVSSIYLQRLPIGKVESRSFAIFFVKLRLPQWIVEPLRTALGPLIREVLFMRFLRQDIEMIESEQRNYLANPQRRYVEINPAIIAVQRLIVRQYEQFVQKSAADQTHLVSTHSAQAAGHKPKEQPVSHAEVSPVPQPQGRV
jgi:renierapurpurin 18,18'-hydroxylase